jgi:hypothetical protein
MTSILSPPVAPWQTPLEKLGFTPNRRGSGYRRNGTLFTTDGGWSVLRSTQALSTADPLRGDLNKPGLWKRVRLGDGPENYRVFDLPPGAWTAEEESAGPGPGCLAWALATAGGRLTEDWQPPPRDTVKAWLPAGGLTVRSGPVVRQGELIHGPGRLALRFPVLSCLPDNLSPARQAWLGELLRDGQNRWRLVRLGLTGEDEPAAALAEVDLSGCPHALLESLFGASLAALRWVVEWLVQGADFLADTAVACQALELCPERAEARGKEGVACLPKNC